MNPIFQHKMKVRDYELGVQNIVNNANYQRYYEVTRHDFIESLDSSFSKLNEQGVDPVLFGINIKYIEPLKASEEFYCTVESLEKKGIRYYFNQKIIRISDNTLCSETKVETVCLIDGKPVYPQFFDKIFEKYI